MNLIFWLGIIICFYILFVIYKCLKVKDITMFWYIFLKYPLGIIFRIYYPFRILNRGNIPSHGPVILCGNHRHLMDQCLPILLVKRPIHYMAKIEYFQNYKTRWFFKLVGTIPVDRSIHDKKAKGRALNILKKGQVIGIFPEGTRNKTNETLLPFKFGAVSLAHKTNATIVPFAITGDYKFRTKNLQINFGTPFQVGKMSLEDANQKLYQEILNLIEGGKE